MHTPPMGGVLAEAIVGRHLLTHPFYRRWDAGQLAEGELAAYAEQYRHIERALPETLATIADALPAGRARELVEANLADELGSPEPHTELFESFAGPAGAAPRAPASPSTATLLALVTTAAATDPAAALAMVAAYEAQAADIAATKSEGLRRHYGFDRAGTRFWDVHVTQEAVHATWSTDALNDAGADPDSVLAAAVVSADSWWLFLSEREELAPAPAG